MSIRISYNHVCRPRRQDLYAVYIASHKPQPILCFSLVTHVIKSKIRLGVLRERWALEKLNCYLAVKYEGTSKNMFIVKMCSNTNSLKWWDAEMNSLGVDRPLGNTPKHVLCYYKLPESYMQKGYQMKVVLALINDMAVLADRVV